MARIVPVRPNPGPMSRVPRSTDRWNLAWEKEYQRTGDAGRAKEYADRVVRQNPFGTSFVEGIGTGTGLAIAAGVAGPLVVRRVRGALKKVGVRR